MPPANRVSMEGWGGGLELGAEADVQSAHQEEGSRKTEVEEVAHDRASRGRVEFITHRPPTLAGDESKAGTNPSKKHQSIPQEPS